MKKLKSYSKYFLILGMDRYGITEAEVLAPSGIQYIVDSYETVTDDSFEFLYIHVHE